MVRRFAGSQNGRSILKTESSLITHNLKTRIVRLLEANYKKTGKNGPVSWRGIWIESGAEEGEFCQALSAAMQEHPPAIIFVDCDHIKLNLKGPAESINTRGDTRSAKTRTSAALRSRLLFIFGSSPPDTSTG
jgi:hypothetical protein